MAQIKSLNFSEKDNAELFKTAQDNNFIVLRSETFPELNITASDFEHIKTGARYINLGTDDLNNSFCVTFKTPGFDSSGLQHVLEHLSLSGSLAYPCRDPFFKMLSRSVSTFMNAITYPDHTSYPFTTTNEKDFYNLASVYSDSVFRPILNPLDFLQEGWRLEHKDVNDKTSPVVFKGVVFNEMAGAYSSNITLCVYSFLKSVLPISYPHENGGLPLEIPNLKYDTLKSYHQTYYQPSNSCFMTYGSIPVATHLKFLNNVLMSSQKVSVDSSVLDENHWTLPRRVTAFGYPDPLISDKKRQITLTVGYKMKSYDTYDMFVMSIIASLLIDGPNCPFYASLIEPHIGLDYSPILGYIEETKHRIFAIGLAGIGESDIENVENIIQRTFEKVVNEGFDKQHVNDLIDTLELKFKHHTPSRGLNFVLAAASVWSHDFSPLDAIRYQFLLDRFKNDYNNGPEFLLKFIQDEILDNSHKLTHIFKPDPDFKSIMNKKAEDLLDSRLKNLSILEMEEIYKQGLDLKKHQEDSKSVACDFLPLIRLSDLNREQYTYDINQLVVENVPIQFCIRPTNGVTYFKSLIDISKLPYILKSYLPLFCDVIIKIGAGDFSHKEFSSRKRRFVRDLKAIIKIVPHHTDNGEFSEFLQLSSYSLNDKTMEMFAIWVDIFNKPHLHEKDVIETVLLELSDKLAPHISDNGHRFAMIAAASSLTYGGQLSEKYNGLSQISFIKSLAETKNIDDIVEKFELIAFFLLNSNKMKCAVNTSQDHVVGITDQISRFICLLPASTSELPSSKKFLPKSIKKFIKMPFDVNYIGKALPGLCYNHPDHPTLVIAAQLISLKYLHPEIREKGGAYGAGLVHEEQTLRFFSYRDPNIRNTMDVFQKTHEWIASGIFTNEELEEAKVKIIGKLDAPISPSDYGNNMFLASITHKMVQTFRDRVFETTREQVTSISDKYLNGCLSSVVVIGADPSQIIDENWEVQDLSI